MILIGLLRLRTKVGVRSITWVETAYQGLSLGWSVLVSLITTTDYYEKMGRERHRTKAGNRSMTFLFFSFLSFSFLLVAFCKPNGVVSTLFSFLLFFSLLFFSFIFFFLLFSNRMVSVLLCSFFSFTFFSFFSLLFFSFLFLFFFSSCCFFQIEWSTHVCVNVWIRIYDSCNKKPKNQLCFICFQHCGYVWACIL